MEKKLQTAYLVAGLLALLLVATGIFAMTTYNELKDLRGDDNINMKRDRVRAACVQGPDYNQPTCAKELKDLERLLRNLGKDMEANVPSSTVEFNASTTEG